MFVDGAFFAVARSGNGDRLITSTNGINWSVKPGLPDNEWRAIACSYTASASDRNNPILLAVSSSGTNRVVSSADFGDTWSSVLGTLDMYTWVDACGGWFFNGSQRKYVIIALSPSGICATNPIFSYSTRSMPNSNSWRALAFSPDSEMFVAVAASNTDGAHQVAYTKDGGQTWTGASPADTSEWTSVTYGKGLFVAVAYSPGIMGYQVMTSPDGVNWTGRYSPFGYVWESVCFTDDRFVAVGMECYDKNAVEKHPRMN